LRDAKSAFDAEEVQVVVVGNGQPQHARMFREDERVPFRLWVDPEMTAYRAAGLRRGVGQVLTARSVGHSLRAWKGGFRQTRTMGDPWQNGGVFIISPQGETLFQHKSREAGDHASVAELLEVLRRRAA
jgi:peroxiredoxin